MINKGNDISIFVFSAGEDNELCQRLDTHLSQLKRQGLINVRYSRDVTEGIDLAATINTYLREVHLILVLISASSLASEFLDSIEMKKALERHKRGDVTIVPILLRPVDWNNAPFSNLRVLPTNGKPVTTWRDKEEAFADIVRTIRTIIEGKNVSQVREASLFEETASELFFPWPFNIPDEPYYLLPKRERHLEQLLSKLLDKQGHRIFVIDGLGGLGKTSIGVELVRRALVSNQFEGIVGDSAKQEQLIGGEIITLKEAKLDFSRLLDQIAMQMKYPEIRSMKEETKKRALADLFQQRPYLILVDNIETFEDIDKTVSQLSSIVGRSRVIITSRKSVKHPSAVIRTLNGLEQEDSLFFLRKEIERTDNQQLLKASEGKLVEIHNVTGGAPLAMKLIAAQTKYHNLDTILKQLRHAGSELYRFIYQRSWQELSEVAQFVLIYVGKTVVTTVSWQELVDAQFTENEQLLQTAIEQLVTSSLLDTSSDGEQIRYGIHQLTRQFVTSDLPKIWELL